MEAGDDFSDTMSQTSLRSRRSLHSMRPPGTPSMGGGGLKTPAMLPPGSAPRAMAAAAPPSVGRRASVRGGEDMPMARVAGGGAGMGDDGMSDASRDVGGLELEGWDEKFVYKVSGVVLCGKSCRRATNMVDDDRHHFIILSLEHYR